MDPSVVAEWTRAMILATVAIWVLWDLAVVLLAGRSATISHVLWTWSLEHRWFAPAVGIAGALLYWHFFVG